MPAWYCSASPGASWACGVDLDVQRLIALDADCDVEAIRAQLELVRRICDGAGPVGRQTHFRALSLARIAAEHRTANVACTLRAPVTIQRLHWSIC